MQDTDEPVLSGPPQRMVGLNTGCQQITCVMFVCNSCPNSPNKKDNLQWVANIWTKGDNIDFWNKFALSERSVQVEDTRNRLFRLSQGQPWPLDRSENYSTQGKEILGLWQLTA